MKTKRTPEKSKAEQEAQADVNRQATAHDEATAALHALAKELGVTPASLATHSDKPDAGPNTFAT